MDAHWAYTLEENPTLATAAGVNDYNHLLPQVSPLDQNRRLRAEEIFLQQLREIDQTQLSAANNINYQLLAWVLETSIEGMRLNTERIPFNTFSSFFAGALQASHGVPMTTEADYRAYIARIGEFPRYFRENIENMREGIRTGFVLPKIIIDGVLPTVQAQVYDNPEMSSLFEPIAAVSTRLPVAVQEQLRSDARQAITLYAVPAFRELVEFLEEEYYPAASEGLAAEELSNGEAFYAHQIKVYTTRTDLSADQIHNIGLAEVARIRLEMDEVIADTGFNGSFEEFTNFLRSDPQFYASDAQQLLKEAAFVAKKIDYVMPEFFGRLPRVPYGVVPVPDEIAPNYTTASYNSGPVGGTRGGAYWVNTFALDQRPLYELPALTLHEAVPGHHQQTAIARELEDLPPFRRELYFSAFGEGWGLYSEKLGIEMGIYQTAYEHFGRLSYEMWRACRLVIDTGIHAQGWTRQRALDYLSDNTSLSAANVRAEVDRYISWPGQALAYKLGEMKISELRQRAEEELGDAFDIRSFHDALLGQGSLPLDLLETVVEAYIAESK
ncbi:MAG TPA: DUF885 domain-containing protein [Rhodospirillales bacterium]|nr:DUF885 domain-containing protein [Gammaproteobacteria bacterium]HIB22380.1 DUF885 domain-containing protein [Rhodospirillales bacterium]HIF85828.1 DUF885 domain-containing protein [Gammaproteobacteria bacterium]HIN89063.1 DUF885 domain-containing protein [Porticoccaceae bacterium]